MADKVPSFKMTTPIPASITTPDSVETSIGTLEFFDGVPKSDTVSTVYEYLDRARAVEVFIDSLPLMSMAQLRRGQADAGAKTSNQVCIWDTLMDSTSFVPTGNTSTMYAVGFWSTIVQATTMDVAGERWDGWSAWAHEVRFAFGWPEFYGNGFHEYAGIVAHGHRSVPGGELTAARVEERIAAIEHLLDLAGESGEFAAAVNNRARHFRVGVRLNGRRFAPITSDVIHSDVVQPVPVPLASPDLGTVNDLYRKAFARVFAGDYSGAVTAAMSAVAEMLRLGLDTTGGTLNLVAQRARSVGWIIAAVEQSIVKLAALREASDAHTAGTDSPEVAMFSVQQTAVIIRYLADTQTQPRVSQPLVATTRRTLATPRRHPTSLPTRRAPSSTPCATSHSVPPHQPPKSGWTSPISPLSRPVASPTVRPLRESSRTDMPTAGPALTRFRSRSLAHALRGSLL